MKVIQFCKFSDPSLWSHTNVQHWFSWAINQFKLKGVRATDWVDVDGPALCNMTHTEFLQRIPIDSSSKDPNHDLFWTHLELLRKCKFVGKVYDNCHTTLTYHFLH